MSLAKASITRKLWDDDLQVYSPFAIRDKLIDCEVALRKQARELFYSQQISFSEYQSITNDLQSILDFAAKINSIGFNQVLTDMDEPAGAILKAIDDLNAAASKIKGYQKFFDILSRLIKLGGVILSAVAAVSTGNPVGSVASIGSLVAGIQDLVDHL